MDKLLLNPESNPRASRSLWLALALPPLAWAVQMEINYALVPFHCYSGTRLPIFIVAVVALLTTGVSELLAYRSWRRSSIDDHGTVKYFLASLALFSGPLFGLVILAQLIASIVFSPCLS